MDRPRLRGLPNERVALRGHLRGHLYRLVEQWEELAGIAVENASLPFLSKTEAHMCRTAHANLMHCASELREVLGMPKNGEDEQRRSVLELVTRRPYMSDGARIIAGDIAADLGAKLEQQTIEATIGGPAIAEFVDHLRALRLQVEGGAGR